MLRFILPAIALTVAACSNLPTQQVSTPVETPPISPSTLIGTWDVSLYFSEDQPPSSTALVVESGQDGVLEGSFYGSPFSDSGVTAFEGDILFTAVTADGTGPYLHSGRLSKGADMIEGQTLSTGRDFLMAWTATRQIEED